MKAVVSSMDSSLSQVLEDGARIELTPVVSSMDSSLSQVLEDEAGVELTLQPLLITEGSVPSMCAVSPWPEIGPSVASVLVFFFLHGRKLSIVLHIFAAFFRFLSLCSGRPISLYRCSVNVYYSALRECTCLRMRTIQLRRAELPVQRAGGFVRPPRTPPAYGPALCRSASEGVGSTGLSTILQRLAMRLPGPPVT